MVVYDDRAMCAIGMHGDYNGDYGVRVWKERLSKKMVKIYDDWTVGLQCNNDDKALM